MSNPNPKNTNTELEFTKQQKEAMDAIIAWFQLVYKNQDLLPDEREFYLAGYAGTGKTTLAKEVINEIKKQFRVSNVITGSYTGKAVDVLRNKGVRNCMTIHSMIYIPKKDKKTGKTTFVISPFAPANQADLIVLDECSMVDKKMAKDLRSFNKPILIMGDPGQLPPISGAGFVTGRKPDYFLTEIHRQAQDSPILQLATMARNGDKIKPGVYGDSVLVTSEYNRDILNKYVMKRGTQPICGANKTRHLINRTFRKRMGVGGNPLPQAGEKLICCQNDAEIGIFNGMMGRAFADTIEDEMRPRQCTVFFKNDSQSEPFRDAVSSWQAIFKQNYDNNIPTPDYRKGTQKFDFGYCLTCHKAQGSEWDTVTVLDESYMFRNNANKWLYTAITRAIQRLIIIQK